MIERFYTISQLIKQISKKIFRNGSVIKLIIRKASQYSYQIIVNESARFVKDTSSKDNLSGFDQSLF